MPTWMFTWIFVSHQVLSLPIFVKSCRLELAAIELCLCCSQRGTHRPVCYSNHSWHQVHILFGGWNTTDGEHNMERGGDVQTHPETEKTVACSCANRYRLLEVSARRALLLFSKNSDETCYENMHVAYYSSKSLSFGNSQNTNPKVHKNMGRVGDSTFLWLCVYSGCVTVFEKLRRNVCPK